MTLCYLTDTSFVISSLTLVFSPDGGYILGGGSLESTPARTDMLQPRMASDWRRAHEHHAIWLSLVHDMAVAKAENNPDLFLKYWHSMPP